jgi:hypothetical protein
MSDGARRFAWFVGLWVAGVATLAVFAYALRAIIGL